MSLCFFNVTRDFIMASLPNLPSHFLPAEPSGVRINIPLATHGPGQLFGTYRPWDMGVVCPGSPPSRKTKGAAGYDIPSPIQITIPARNSVSIDTGIRISIWVGHYGRIEGRSGLAMNHDIVPFCGIIDEDYRGPIAVKLFNHSDKDYVVKIGDRIAQLIIQPYATPTITKVHSLNNTERGSSGFGSTGY